MNIFRILLFFPSITFSLLSAEIFPWAFIYSIIKKLKSYRKINIQKRVLVLVIGLFISLSYSFYVILSTSYNSDVLRSFVAYLNPILVYLIILGCSKRELSIFCNMIEKILGLFILIGIFQTIGIINFLEPIFKFIVPRSSTQSLVEMGGRGVTLLSSEPSRAAYEIIFIYATWSYINRFIKYQYIFDFFFLIFILLIIRSSEGIVLLLIYLIAKYGIKFIFTVSVLGLFLASTLLEFQVRSVSFLYSLFIQSSFLDIYYLILNQSGFRLISLIASYRYAFFHPFGGGIGLWENTSIIALNETQINPNLMYYFEGGYTAIRPISFLSSIALDMGVIGLFLIYYTLRPLFILLKNVKDPMFCFIVLFLFGIFFSGSIGNPVPWICMAICYKYYKNSNKFNCLSISVK
jgi:hypothetical protein